jgi:uncharacterized membrane protein YfcA
MTFCMPLPQPSCSTRPPIFRRWLLFIYKDHIWWHFALAMALANVVGSLVGTHMALKHGTGFVRGVFIAVVSALILKTSYDAFLR